MISIQRPGGFDELRGRREAKAGAKEGSEKGSMVAREAKARG
jgi:hypothetical protein